MSQPTDTGPTDTGPTDTGPTDVWSPESPPIAPAIPSATVAIVRDGSDGALEVLMVRRPSRPTDHFSGKWVFPGGKVDAEDRSASDLDADEIEPARRAAVREVFEEVAMTMSPTALVPLNRWEPDPINDGNRRFAAWVFVGVSSGDDVTVDGVELHEHDWVTPAEAMRRHATFEMDIAPPTWHTLLVLDEHASADALMSWASGRSPEHFFSRMAFDDGHALLAWHGDVLKGGDAHHRHRLWMIDGAWRYERNV